jgi:Mn-containing catalase
MAKAARAASLTGAREKHLEETKVQLGRLKEAFDLIGVQARSKPCTGMAGLIEEGDEIIEERAEDEDAVADLALIAAAQRVEHYEISAYGTARAMAGQAGLPAVAELLSKSLAEEKVADNLMTQLARELMSEARTGVTKEPKRGRATMTVENE